LNIFDIINNIAFSKKTITEGDAESEDSANVYMVNRWVSMIDGSAAHVINNTLNRYHNIFPKKNDAFNFLKDILPCYPRQRIHYIKKPTA
jgi:hypothetical protein